jgi:microtubule-associated protein-like 1/2
VITGDSDGNVIFWNYKNCRIEKIIKNATNSCFSLIVLEKTLLVGGKDGKLTEWTIDDTNEDFRRTDRFFALPEGGCRTILELANGSILIGTTQNSIYQIEFGPNSETHRLNCVVNGHYDEMWGLTSSQLNSSGRFLTCSNDRTLSQWDAETHSNMWSIQLDEKLHCVATHPSLELAAIGTRCSKWFIFDLTKLQVVHTGQVDSAEQPIECIRYSPNGQYLACACRDSLIYIYEVSEDGLAYTKVGKCSGHSSYVRHIDWSADSKYLISNSSDYETLYWDAKTCKQLIHAQEIRVIQWIQNTTCTLTFNTLGLWHSK